MKSEDASRFYRNHNNIFLSKFFILYRRKYFLSETFQCIVHMNIGMPCSIDKLNRLAVVLCSEIWTPKTV